jgi:hypothetical protein
MLTAACITPALSQAAPQTFNTALPVSKGNFVLRQQLLHRKASRGRGAMARNLEVSGGISVLGYGATSELALFGVLPYLDKELDLTTPGGQRLTRSASGIGDAQVFARYTLLQQDRHGRTFRIASFIGVKLPTGDDDGSDGLGRLQQPLQSGSGSWDPLGGVVATYQTLDYQVDAQLSYKANTEANDFQFGDEFRLDASLQYRLVPRELGAAVPGFLYGVIETNFLHQTKDEIGGLDDPDSGGTMLFLSPGLQYVTKQLIVETIVQIPVVQHPNGAALEDEYTLRAGFRLNF